MVTRLHPSALGPADVAARQVSSARGLDGEGSRSNAGSRSDGSLSSGIFPMAWPCVMPSTAVIRRRGAHNRRY
jgi:hypothetical protein